MFSNQPSDESSRLSGEITQIIELVAGFLHLNTVRFDLHLFVRKAAHFSEFAVLGFLLFAAIYPSRKADTYEEGVCGSATQKSADQKTVACTIDAKKATVNKFDTCKTDTVKLAVKAGVLAQLAGMSYAVFDEIHQIFIPGRSCQVKDMLIDSSGVLLAVLLRYVFVSNKAGRNRKKIS